MRIENFHIQGFKSINDIAVERLSEINVFYGLNDVGKSNIFQAIALWHRLLTASNNISLEQLETEFGSPIFRLGGSHKIGLKVVVSIEKESSLGETVLRRMAQRSPRFDPKDNSIRLMSEVKIEPNSGKALYQIVNRAKVNVLEVDLTEQDLAQTLPGFHIIEATRRFQTEKRNGQELGSISDRNLKQALFYAYLSRDIRQKRRLEAIKNILADPPFNLGRLDVALDPITDQIDIGFVRPDGRLPLDSMGSGVQQLLLVLGQIFLNDYPVIAIEEPEMNLSPQYQQYLLVALRRLMEDSDTRLNQLFISTHSPYFEFAENFFDVSLDEQGTTQVARLPFENRNRYFPDTSAGPQTGARLNSFNQVKLYEGVIEDLGLQRGDLVLFTKNEAGRWEIRPENEIIYEIETVFEDQE